jgi:hypothetical protein
MSTDGDLSGHGKSYEICGGKKRQGDGGPCTRPAGWGTDHPGVGKCKFHGGSTRTHRVAGEIQLARVALHRLGVPLDIADPADMLLSMVRESAGNLRVLREMVNELIDPVQLQQMIDLGWTADRPLAPMYAAMRHASGAHTGLGKEHVVVSMYDSERERLVKFSAEALKAGIAERQVKLAEQLASSVAAAMMSLLDDPALGLSRDQREAGRKAAGRHLRVLAS